MPTYQYACTACGHQLEAVQTFSDPPLTICPECDGALRKVFSSVGIVFKGSGFYRTDSRSGSASSEAASNGGAKPDTPSSAGSGSAESKPASESKSSSESSTTTKTSTATATPST